jgi:AhpD family alkylhydroperoxidase
MRGGAELENESSEMIKLLQEGQDAIQEYLPGVLENFMGVTQSTMKQELIPPRTKELMAVAVAVGIRCQPCIVHHVKRALDQGATAAEIMEACSVAIMMGGGPSIAYTSYVVQTLNDFKAFSKKD